MPLVGQLVHGRYVLFGPLVLEKGPFKIPTLVVDRRPNCLHVKPTISSGIDYILIRTSLIRIRAYDSSLYS